MHELVMAQQIVRAVLATMEQRGAAAVRSIDVELGALEGIREEDLRRAFRLESTGTPLEHAALHVSVGPATAFCPGCNAPKTFDLRLGRFHEIPRVACPDCGVDLELQGGRGLLVRRAAMVLEDP